MWVTTTKSSGHLPSRQVTSAPRASGLSLNRLVRRGFLCGGRRRFQFVLAAQRILKSAIALLSSLNIRDCELTTGFREPLSTRTRQVFRCLRVKHDAPDYLPCQRCEPFSCYNLFVRGIIIRNAVIVVLVVVWLLATWLLQKWLWGLW
jgi:hypothetical protein